ncbi:MAG: hypothetical protein GXX91_02775 [Verrucomicrobiaceae bacterium]|nr:hypothetical protein [Verrucomicrobiaceae bacterium]
MNTWAYLILIGALLFLAAVMLYARFATRSREKSLHHAPADWMLSSEAIAAEQESAGTEEREDEARVRPEVKVDRVAPSALSRNEAEGESKRRESEYFDELQEAAAGLAMLMRSSPVGRTEPVVFAPAEGGEEVESEVPENEVEAEECVFEEPLAVAESIDECPESVEAESAIDPEPETTVDPVAESAVADEAPVETESIVETESPVEADPIVLADVPTGSEEEECEVPLPAEVRVLTTREILGEEVTERMDRIDEGLDALESLVLDIESSLLALDSSGPFEGEEDIDASATEFVPAAA